MPTVVQPFQLDSGICRRTSSCVVLSEIRESLNAYSGAGVRLARRYPWGVFCDVGQEVAHGDEQATSVDGAGIHRDKDAQLNRLRRIEGQIVDCSGWSRPTRTASTS